MYRNCALHQKGPGECLDLVSSAPPFSQKKKGGGKTRIEAHSPSLQPFSAPRVPRLDSPARVAHCARAAGFPRLPDAKCLGCKVRAHEFSGGVGDGVQSVTVL